MISVSIVSHRQAEHVVALLSDVDRHCQEPLEILVTVNVPEPQQQAITSSQFPLQIARNRKPMGFGANHNAAFTRAKGEYFCVLNPDIRMQSNPFPALIDCLIKPKVGVCAPVVLSPDGQIEDSAREFPTPLSIVAKAIGHHRGAYALSENAEQAYPDWVAGMFMLFPASVFGAVGGFDERYHLYYEDVDLCARMRLAGYEVVLCPKASVVHHARRESHRSLRHFAWHLTSMTKFFTSSTYRKVMRHRTA